MDTCLINPAVVNSNYAYSWREKEPRFSGRIPFDELSRERSFLFPFLFAILARKKSTMVIDLNDLEAMKRHVRFCPSAGEESVVISPVVVSVKVLTLVTQPRTVEHHLRLTFSILGRVCHRSVRTYVERACCKKK